MLKFYLEVDWFDKFAETVMWKNLVGRNSYQKQSSWTALRAKEIWLADRYRALKLDWLNSSRSKTSLGEIPIPHNPFWATFHVAKIRLVDCYRALKPDWLNSLMLKTVLGETPMSANPSWAIFYVAEIWLACANKQTFFPNLRPYNPFFQKREYKDWVRWFLKKIII